MVIESDAVGFSEAERAEEARLKPISHLKEAVDLLTPDDRELFLRLYELVDGRFTNDGHPRQNGHMDIPPPMENFVFGQFRRVVGTDNQEEVNEAVKKQWSVTITDRFMKRKAKFNPLRGARPQERTDDNFFLQRIEATRGIDDFCNPETSTPEGPFGRLKDEWGTSCGNLTEFGDYHEILLGPHDPYEMRREHFISQMNKALLYGHMVYGQDKDHEARHLTWGMNFGPKSGGSRVHQHSQVIVDRGTMHQPEVEEFHEAMVHYRERNPDRNYLTDWLRVHEALGLAVYLADPESSEGIWVVMPLTPFKERHVIVTGPKLAGYNVSDKFANTCWDVIEHMMKSPEDGGESVMEFNTIFSMTPFGRADGDDNYWADFWPMFHFVDRGVSTTPVSDIGFMEISRSVVLSSDPKKTAPKLFRALRQKAA